MNKRRQRVILLLYAGVFFGGGSNAQFLPGPTHTVAAGWGNHRLSDESTGLTTQAVNTRNFAYEFQTGNEARVKRFSLLVEHGSSSTIELAEFRLRYSDAFILTRSVNSPFKSYIGYALETNPVYTRLRDRGQGVYSWNNTNSLILYTSQSYSWQRSRISLDISLPVIGMASRPAEAPVLKTTRNELLYDSYGNMFLTSFHNFRSVSLDLTYSAMLSNRFSLKGNYNLRYKKLTDTYDFLESVHGVGVGIVYHMH